MQLIILTVCRFMLIIIYMHICLFFFRSFSRISLWYYNQNIRIYYA